MKTHRSEQQAKYLRIIGQRIRMLRETRWLTQEELASMVGLTRTTIPNMEAGRQDFTITFLARLALCLHVPITAIVPPLSIIKRTKPKPTKQPRRGRKT